MGMLKILFKPHFGFNCLLSVSRGLLNNEKDLHSIILRINDVETIVRMNQFPQLGDDFPPDSGIVSTMPLISNLYQNPCRDGELTISLSIPFYSRAFLGIRRFCFMKWNHVELPKWPSASHFIRSAHELRPKLLFCPVHSFALFLPSQ